MFVHTHTHTRTHTHTHTHTHERASPTVDCHRDSWLAENQAPCYNIQVMDDTILLKTVEPQSVKLFFSHVADADADADADDRRHSENCISR